MRVIRCFLSVFLSILIFLSAFVTVLTAVVKFKLTNADYYLEAVITDEYIGELHEDIYENVTTICENLEVHRDTVMSFVSENELRRISEHNFKAFFSSFINGVELQYEHFENEDLKDEIYKELDEFATQAGIVDEDISHATDVTYEFIIDDINSTLTYFTQENMDAVSFVSRIPFLDFISNNAFFVAVAVLAVLCVLKFAVLGRRRVLSFFYNTSFMMWLASACWFIPVTVIKLQEIAMKIAIAHSGFRIYVQNLINAVIDGFFNVSMWCFIVSAVFLIGSIVTIIISATVSTKRAKTADEVEDKE